MQLSRETPADWWEVEALYDLCFAPGREALHLTGCATAWRRSRTCCLFAAGYKRRGRRDPVLAGAGGRGARVAAGSDCRAPHPPKRRAGRLADPRNHWTKRAPWAGRAFCWWVTRPITGGSGLNGWTALPCRHPQTPRGFWGWPWCPAHGRGVRPGGKGSFHQRGDVIQQRGPGAFQPPRLHAGDQFRHLIQV